MDHCHCSLAVLTLCTPQVLNYDYTRRQRWNVSLKKHFEKAFILQETSKRSKSWIPWNFCNGAFLPDAFLHEVSLHDAFSLNAFQHDVVLCDTLKCDAFSSDAKQRDAFLLPISLGLMHAQSG